MTFNGRGTSTFPPDDVTDVVLALGIDTEDDPAAATQAELDAHTTDAADAHDASAVSVLDTALNYTGADLEAVLVELADLRTRLFTNEVQTITLTSWDATDTVKFTFNAHETTAVTHAADVSAAIQAALIALVDFEAGDLVVTQTDIDHYVVTFGGNQAGKNVGPITVTNGTGSAGGTVAETTKGGQLKTAAGATLASKIIAFAAGDVNIAATNPVTVTGIAVGDQLIAILKDSTPNLTHVALSDATIGSGTITFAATSFGANDGIVVLYLDLT